MDAARLRAVIFSSFGQRGSRIRPNAVSRRWPVKHCLVVAVLATLIVGWSAGSTNAADEPGRVAVDVPSVVLVDHPKNTGTGTIYVRNPGKIPVRVALRVSDFATSAGKRFPATVAFTGPGGSATANVYEATVEPGTVQAVKLEVADVWEGGESTAKILDHDREVAVLRVAKYRVPLAVRIVGTGSDPVVVTFEAGKPGTLWLKNDDPMTYDVQWRLTIGADATEGSATLPPNGTAATKVTLNLRWFSAPLEGFFKDETRDGTLALRLRPSVAIADPGSPERVIPLRARLVYWSSAWRSVATVVVVFAVLFAGALSSLMLNQWLPNRLRRIDLEERLGDIAARTRNVSFRVDSSLRILVRVERYRLLRLLGSRYAFSPEMARVLTTCAQATDRLETKVGLLERIDAVGDDVRRLRLVAPPSQLSAVEARLQKAADRLRSNQPTDADVQEAATIVTEATTKLGAIQQADTEFVKDLVERFAKLQKAFEEDGPLSKNKWWDEVISNLGGLVSYLKGPSPQPGLPAADYYEHDLKLLRLGLVHEYLRLHGERSDDQRQPADTKGDALFLKHVGGGTVDGYVQARLDLRAIRENIFTSKIEEEIRGKQIRIEAQPADPRPHQAVELSAVFASDASNSAGARDEYECCWVFKHIDSDGRSGDWLEKGWHVNHFFPKPDKYEVKATFRKKDDGTVIADETKPIEVVGEIPVGSDNTSWFSDRTWIEGVRFAVVLFATILGLLGGAREQLMRLDVAAGLVAVFLIGFGADTVKNMLVDRGSTLEPAKK